VNEQPTPARFSAREPWRRCNKLARDTGKIHEAAERANREDERVALLAAHKAVMDIAESAGVHADDLGAFRTARRQDYNVLVINECMVGDTVCTDTAYSVTRREIAAGRMAATCPTPSTQVRKTETRGSSSSATKTLSARLASSTVQGDRTVNTAVFGLLAMSIDP
jgi:hypothetical protein